MGTYITFSAATDDPGQLIFRMEMIGCKEAGFLEFPDKKGGLVETLTDSKAAFLCRSFCRILPEDSTE
jgi:hypothetical protein